jgi:hypothetical protein
MPQTADVHSVNEHNMQAQPISHLQCKTLAAAHVLLRLYARDLCRSTLAV